MRKSLRRSRLPDRSFEHSKERCEAREEREGREGGYVSVALWVELCAVAVPGDGRAGLALGDADEEDLET